MTDHPIPFAALDGKVGVLGATGSGKSFTSVGLVELLLDDGQQVIIIDPTGAYTGLRTAFPLPIFGGKFGDVPITEADGAAVARAIVDGGLSAIVDVSLLLKESHASARRFMAAFVAVLKNAPTGARYLVIDEADEFMPEHTSGAVTQLFGDLKWIVRRGRIEGWRMMMVTQRPQDIAKSVLTQCEMLIVHRLPSPQDRKAVEEWVKGHAEPGQAKEVLQSLASLETGEAWVWAPRHNILVRARMPLNRSEDRSKTPDAADAPRATLGFQDVDIDALRNALAGVGASEPDPVDDPTWKDSVQREDQSKRAAGAAVTRANEDAQYAAELFNKVKELEEQLDGMEKRALKAEDLLSQFISSVGIVENGLASIYEEIRGTMESFGFTDAVRFGASEHLEKHGWEKPSEIPAQGGGVPEGDDRQTGVAKEPAPAKRQGEHSDGAAQGATGGKDPIPPRQHRILAAVAWTQGYLKLDAVPRNIVAWMAETSPNSSGFEKDLGAMRTNGLLTYPTPGNVALTDEGRALAPRQSRPATREALWAEISKRLPPRQIRLVEALLDGNDRSRAQLAADVSTSPQSSGFEKDLGRLRTLGLIEYPQSGWVGLGSLLK